MTDGLTDWLHGEPEAWLREMEKDVRRNFDPLLGRYSPEEAAVEWILETEGSVLGEDGRQKARSIFQRVSDEVTALVCGDRRYEKERAELRGASLAARASIITAISLVIGHALFLPAVVVTAPVAVVLYTISKVGQSAWCAGKREVP